jgi:hypothetical protein
MSERALRILLVAMAALMAGIGGYVFGFASGRSAERTLEAAQDLIVPAEDVRRERIRRDGIRSMTQQVAGLQSRSHDEGAGLVTLDSLPLQTDGYVLEETTDYWRSYSVVVVRDMRSPHGEVCAVSLNREPAYAAGILLRRAGRVRCSWDLATRVNLWLSGG